MLEKYKEEQLNSFQVLEILAIRRKIKQMWSNFTEDANIEGDQLSN